MQAHPKKFDVVKIRAKFLKIGKIRRNLGKICENLGKTPENLGKLSENTAKMASNVLWLEKIGPQRVQNHMKTFFIPKTVFMRKIRTKSGPKFFRANLRKFGKKSFAPPKICLLLLLWPI